MHKEMSKLAGKTVKIVKGEFAGQEYRVEDWWDRVYGKSWMDSNGNPAALEYALRKVPFDDEVLYGKIGPMAILSILMKLRSRGRIHERRKHLY